MVLVKQFAHDNSFGRNTILKEVTVFVLVNSELITVHLTQML